MEDFVNFKIAKKLKEKGFKEECVAHYYSNDPTCLIKNTALADYVRQPFCIESIKRSWNRCELNPCSSGCYYDVPTILQVMKWLRDEKGIHITICVCGDGWFYEVINISSGKSLVEDYEDDIVQSYEEASIAGIEYVLNNLI